MSAAEAPYYPNGNHYPNMVNFRFADLFAGIGGFRLGCETLGGQCVRSAEVDYHACKVYCDNFGEPFGPESDRLPNDIRDIGIPGANSDLPNPDVITAGFPCQPYSRCYTKAKGIADPRGGPMFAELLRVIHREQPPLVVLENVPGLLSPRAKSAWDMLHDGLMAYRYRMTFRVVNAIEWVPTRRKRLFVVAWKPGPFSESAPDISLDGLGDGNCGLTLGDIVEPLSAQEAKAFRLTAKLWEYLRKHREDQRAAGRNFGYQDFELDQPANVITARYNRDGSECLLWDEWSRRACPPRPRKLTVREAARVMGFPDTFRFTETSGREAYRLIGNAVCPPVVSAVVRRCLPFLRWAKANKRRMAEGPL